MIFFFRITSSLAKPGLHTKAQNMSTNTVRGQSPPWAAATPQELSKETNQRL
jgi:hypothetical protein